MKVLDIVFNKKSDKQSLMHLIGISLLNGGIFLSEPIGKYFSQGSFKFNQVLLVNTSAGVLLSICCYLIYFYFNKIMKGDRFLEKSISLEFYSVLVFFPILFIIGFVIEYVPSSMLSAGRSSADILIFEYKVSQFQNISPYIISIIKTLFFGAYAFNSIRSSKNLNSKKDQVRGRYR